MANGVDRTSRAVWHPERVGIGRVERRISATRYAAICARLQASVLLRL